MLQNAVNEKFSKNSTGVGDDNSHFDVVISSSSLDKQRTK